MVKEPSKQGTSTGGSDQLCRMLITTELIIAVGNMELLVIWGRVKGVVEKRPDWHGFKRGWEEKR